MYNVPIISMFKLEDFFYKDFFSASLLQGLHKEGSHVGDMKDTPQMTRKPNLPPSTHSDSNPVEVPKG